MSVPYFAQLCIVLIITCAVTVVARRPRGRKVAGQLPPGPRRLPFFGNTFQLSPKHIGTQFRKLYEKYGGIVSLSVGGETIIIIGDATLAREVLEKRGAQFASRPGTNYLTRHVDPERKLWIFHGMTELWYTGRRLTTKAIANVRAGKSEPLQEIETFFTLKGLIQNPENWYNHMNRLSASTSLAAMFGTHFPTGDEQLLKDMLKLTADTVDELHPAATLINVFPALDYLPGPKPWRRRAANMKKKFDDIYERFAALAEEQEKRGVETWASFFALRQTMATIVSRSCTHFLWYAKRFFQYWCFRELKTSSQAAVETTSITLQAFVLACVCYPESFETARAEVDSIIGDDRAPSFDDRDQLPHVESLLRETLRWRPAARLGAGRHAISDSFIEYQGQQYFVPAGSFWSDCLGQLNTTLSGTLTPTPFSPPASSMQLAVYGRTILRPASAGVSGVGHIPVCHSRSKEGLPVVHACTVCPGTPFAERSLWIMIAVIIWAFEVQPVPGHKYRTDDSAFSGDITTRPLEFPAVFKPRNSIRTARAKELWEAAAKVVAMPVVP